ncbi:GDSL-type esterase/lipase family protein [Roseateles asaccharophilus]|uniref:Lysophospholipase L1-like esterase n=1 Tax=Roseateles asaccharophilus TaxID=582607 RepID=A0ABU2A4H9_9BURK|nr:GDSL-type esterase/lipase family protein [Roseateles asaccharophilus]MDR7332049.1 lysophospholipase L1-like esterase [Roseateles asaccharophilus]
MKHWTKGLAVAATLTLAATAHAADTRLQAVMKKLDAGEPITLATVGGSITTGYAATPPREQGWAALLAKSLGPKVKLVNAGISGTDSAAAVQRLQAQVLDAAPDLVVVEFGVNDQWLDPAVRGSSYEAILRKLLAAKKPPAVVVLGLTQQGNQPRDATDLQLKLAAHYGLTALDFGAWMQARVAAGTDRWAALYDEPVHPNGIGHQRIAQALGETLRTATSSNAVTTALPSPLHGRAHEFTRLLMNDALKPYQNSGFSRGGEVHPEWTGQQPGWQAKTDDAEARFLVWGSEVAVFHAESEHYRNLEARVDDGPWGTLRGHVPERKGYLGWHYTVVGRDLEPTAHLLQVRVKRDEWVGSGRPASLLAIMSAGIVPPALRTSAFQQEPPSNRMGQIPADDARLRWVGRIAAGALSSSKLLAWSGSELRARFTGRELSLEFSSTHWGTSHFTVEIDGRALPLAVPGKGLTVWRLREPLADGEHTLRLIKRTEASMAEASFHGLRLAEGGRLLDPPPPRALKLEFYGDSITAGACNGDVNDDQYDDLYYHDGTRAYGALTATKLDADYVGIAVSGIGVTATWNELLMPQVWNRYAPRLDAAQAPPDARAPDVVLANLGQNDHGFPASKGQRIAPDFAPRYLAFVRGLRARYPNAKLVLLAGGMTAWKDEPAIPRALQQVVATLRGEGDARVWTYTFQAFAYAHPRIDVHAQMADELTRFLQTEVLK